MAASFTPPENGAELATQASVFVVMRYDREGGETTIMPNVKPISVHFTQGACPPTAQLAYVLDDVDPDSDWPNTIKDLWPLDAQGDKVLQMDDEILIIEYTPDGDQLLIFDGFVEVPQAELSEGLSTSMMAVGVFTRLWDTVIEGSDWRDADDPEGGEVTTTGLPAIFNPKGHANCTPDDADVDDGDDSAHPVFLDPFLKGDPAPQTKWTLGKFARYLIWKYNKDEEFCKNPVPPQGSLDTFLKAIKPFNGEFIDIDNPSTFTREDIEIKSYDASNKAWIEALEDQLHYYGFEIFFNTRFDSDGQTPINEIIIYRKDGLDGATPQEINYPEDRGSLDDQIPDFNRLSLVRDNYRPINEFRVETEGEKFEISVVLFPLFEIDPADASPTNIKNFDKSKLVNATESMQRKYRWYGIDECGVGHWSFVSSTFIQNAPFDFDSELGAKPGDKRKWTHRFRPIEGSSLISANDQKEHLKIELAISRDYTGQMGKMWDGTGTWRSMGQGSWKPLKHQFGIEITADTPEHWRLPDNDGQTRANIVNGITSMATPGSDLGTKKFFLRLTAVVESDQPIDAVASKRDAAPSQFTVRRSIDSKDHFKKHTVDKSSVFNPSQGTGKPESTSPIDDTDAAKASAEAQRDAHEMPKVAGTITVPWIMHSLGVGDLISRINGQEVELSSSAGEGAGESPYYPVIVAMDYTCQNPQTTTFKISDRRSEPVKP